MILAIVGGTTTTTEADVVVVVVGMHTTTAVAGRWWWWWWGEFEWLGETQEGGMRAQAIGATRRNNIAAAQATVTSTSVARGGGAIGGGGGATHTRVHLQAIARATDQTIRSCFGKIKQKIIKIKLTHKNNSKILKRKERNLHYEHCSS